MKLAELSTSKKRRIVVIAGVAAGSSAASKARRISQINDSNVGKYTASSSIL